MLGERLLLLDRDNELCWFSPEGKVERASRGIEEDVIDGDE